jgi:N-acetylglutamate synthase-like GNAT family acetyltransferase
MVIRPAGAADADEGAALLRRSIAELCHMDHGGDPSAIETWTANKTPASWLTWLEAHSFFYVVEDIGRLVGVCLLSRTGEILLNYVLSDLRFCGISKLMLREVEATGRRQGMSLLRVRTTRTAHRFYAAAEFVEVGDEKAHLLQKPLNSDLLRDEAGGWAFTDGPPR